MPDDANPPPEEAAPAPAEETPAPWRRWAPLAVAVVFPALLFLALPPLTRSGLWDPYELNVADLSRRIAFNLYHAGNLALVGADNSLPHLNDLGRPQLPFSSIALGFKVFGLTEWAGRLPLALWGLLGVLATYAFVARLFDRRTGAYAAVVLSTMPLYFVQARTMLGDVCTMSGLAMAFGGLAVAAFDRDDRRSRASALAGHGGDRSLRRLREPRRAPRPRGSAPRGRPRVGRGASERAVAVGCAG
jgi:4-amino-4-deoxy-L-arabinose transferase-like glycosyltransferase